MINLFIADDHAILREGLKRILEDDTNIRIVGEANSGDETLKKLKNSGADILLLDISMPGPGFLEIIHRIKKYDLNIQILILSAHHEEQYAIRSIQAGADGYLTKDRSPDELEKAIYKIMNGGKYISESLAENLAELLQTGSQKEAHVILSDREFQIFSLLGKGNKLNSIADLLSLSPKTVSTYRARSLEKMGFKDNADIIRYAIELGL